MDDQELPNSPRKKLKLEEPSSDGKPTDTATRSQPFAEAIPHNHTATTIHQINRSATMASKDIPNSDQTCSDTAHVSVIPAVVTESAAEDSHNHIRISGDLLEKKAADVSKAMSKVAGVAGNIYGGDKKEAACGITEFVSRDLLGFSGILKKRYAYGNAIIHVLANLYRYTDFLVNEILPSGEVVHLDNLKAPSKPHRNMEVSRNPGHTSSTNTTEQKTVSLEQNNEEQEQSSASPTTTSKNEAQTFPQPDTSKQEPSTLKPQANLSVVEDSQTIPQSMQGFDKNELVPASVKNQGNISPHKRVPPPTPYIPLSMQDLDGKRPEPKQEEATRRKEKVHIRQTSQGWVEFDKEKEDAIKKRKAEEDAAAGAQTEVATQMEDKRSEEGKDVPEPHELDLEQVQKASTQASWQAFAGSAPSNGFQVSSQSTRCNIC